MSQPYQLPGAPRISQTKIWSEDQRRDLFQIWQDIGRQFNLIARSTGVTVAIATGTVVTHSLGTIPSFVLVTAQDAGPTNITVSNLTKTSFVINFSGGGSHVFGWSAEQ